MLEHLGYVIINTPDYVTMERVLHEIGILSIKGVKVYRSNNTHAGNMIMEFKGIDPDKIKDYCERILQMHERYPINLGPIISPVIMRNPHYETTTGIPSEKVEAVQFQSLAEPNQTNDF